MWSPLAERYIATGEARGIKKGIEQGITEGRVQGIEQGITEGRVQGREIGITEGREIGELEGRIEAIISILDVKFGEISETVRDSLCVITDVNRLQALIRFATKCDTFEEFYKQLNINKT